MSEPVIYGPSGGKLSGGRERHSSQAFSTSSNFDLESGRGSVVFRTPAIDASLLVLLDVLLSLDMGQGEQSAIANAKQYAEKARSLPPAYYLLPAEARTLGMRLIAESEIAVGNAICMRILLEVMRLPADEAIQLLGQVSQGTRADQVMEFEQYLRAERQSAQAQQPPQGEGKPQ